MLEDKLFCGGRRLQGPESAEIEGLKASLAGDHSQKEGLLTPASAPTYLPKALQPQLGFGFKHYLELLGKFSKFLGTSSDHLTRNSWVLRRIKKRDFEFPT